MAVVTFEDGPAERGTAAHETQLALRYPDGQLVLSLRRLPVFLRVVYNRQADTWDGLDQLEDAPRAGEEVHVYVRAEYGHARGLGRFASYRHVPIAGDVPEVRENDRWKLTVERLAVDFAAMLPAYKPDCALHG